MRTANNENCVPPSNKKNPRTTMRFLRPTRALTTFVALLLLLSSDPTNAQQEPPLSNFPLCANYAPPVLVRGRKLYNSVTGEYMPVKGVNYYPRPNEGSLVQTNSIDFFTAEFQSLWENDIAQFVQLGINVVRLYAVQPGVSHDGFMCALKQAGIYVIVGLAADCADCAIAFDASPPDCYPADLKARGQYIIAEFARYDNVLGFSAGNEVSLGSDQGVFQNGPCQKQFIRDMRAYIQNCQATMRHIPVGLAIADVQRQAKATYYNCRNNSTDELENAEFIGVNSYLHCNGTQSPDDPFPGFESLVSDFADYQMTVPVMLTEFGCINPSFPTVDGFEAQRNWYQVRQLYSPLYREELVGGVVFEYSTERINSLAPYPFTTYGDGNFGLGRFDPIDCDHEAIPCTYVPFPQFATLANQYAAVTITDEANWQDLPPSDTVPSPPSCPVGIPPPNSFSWPAVQDRSCPGRVFVQCPATTFPPECTNLGIQVTGSFLAETSTPTSSPVESEPTALTATPTTMLTASPVTSEPTTTTSLNTPTTDVLNQNFTDAPTSTPSISPSTSSPAVGEQTSSPTTTSNTPTVVSVTEAPMASQDDSSSMMPSLEPSTEGSDRNQLEPSSGMPQVDDESAARSKTGYWGSAFLLLLVFQIL